MFIKKPRSTNAYEGDTVIIMCEVIGDPKPEVVWLRDFLKVKLKVIIIYEQLPLLLHSVYIYIYGFHSCGLYFVYL